MAGVLEGKVAVITGGGSGIGEATARLFAGEGCRVVVSGRRLAPIERVARETFGLAVVADVAVEREVAALFAACDAAHGRLDILVNSAGTGGPEASAENTDMAEWERTFAVNTHGLFMCIKHAIPRLKRQGGSIVNISSRVGLQTRANKSAYGASKHAINGITQAVAQEVGAYGIRVNTICPGGVDTVMFREIAAERGRQQGKPAEEIIRTAFVEPAALRRIIRPEEIAAVALFLASDAASAITGEFVKVDAGRM